MIPPLHSLLLFMAAGLALNITPGPDMLYVAARSTSEGRAAGIVSSLGIAAGTLFHITAVALDSPRCSLRFQLPIRRYGLLARYTSCTWVFARSRRTQDTQHAQSCARRSRRSSDRE